ncbi:MAG: ABC transporter permease, partial [Maribacter sp.]|nr:ABC transporter permease [Maribacter sp.]
MYQTEKQIGNILEVFSVLAILVLCLGLFGLLGFSVRQKYKEISVRKILGASTPRILLLLSKEYIRLMIAALVFAVPIAFYFVKAWLREFPYTTIEFSTFIV